MKRLALIFGAAILTAVSAPSTARAQSCTWWDLTCNGLANRVVDNSWHIAGRDQNGNIVYVRRFVDSNGNVVFEQAHRNDLGRYLITNNHMITRGNIFDANGERCNYNQNEHGYKEECKYPKVNNVAKLHPVKYKAAKVKPVKYIAPEVRYEAPKVHEVKYKAPKGNPHVSYDIATKGPKGPKGHEDKDHPGKGPKH